MSRILIIAGDPSGDAHAAEMVRRLKTMSPDEEIAAVGGPALAAAGAKLIANLVGEAVTGFSEVIAHLPHVLKHYVTALTAAKRADLVVFVDYPGFNLALARDIFKLSPRPKMLWYIAPQVWAWNKGRTGVMSRILDRIAVVFPFEEKIFPNAEYVGHPLLDLPVPEPIAEFDGSRVVALLPGSRKNEISRHIGVMIDAAKILARRGWRPVISMSNPDFLPRFERAECELYSGSPRSLLASSEAAIVKSGTSTLETALLGKPLVAIYRLSWISYMIGKVLVDIKHFAMPNILLEEEAVPELLQQQATAERIVSKLEHLDKSGAEKAFSRLRDILQNRGSAQRTAEICLELLGKRQVAARQVVSPLPA